MAKKVFQDNEVTILQAGGIKCFLHCNHNYAMFKMV